MAGKHIIIDITNIKNPEKMMFNYDVAYLLDEIVKQANLNVVGKCVHQFLPIGVTGVYVLAESHLSIHTFPEKEMVSMDLFTCSNPPDITLIIQIINEYLNNKCDINYKIIDR